MSIPVSILAAGAVIAAAILFAFRWEIVPVVGGGGALRLDRWTGAIVFCVGDTIRGPSQMDCTP